MRRGGTWAMVVGAGAAALALAMSGAAAASSSGGAGGAHVLPRPMHGAAAVQALGLRLAGVAAANHRAPATLRQQLLDDRTLWVDTGGRLFYTDVQAPAATSGATVASAPYPYDQTFSLHSKPGSQRTIYLDFNGETISGTAWNASYTSGADFYADPFDTDGSPTTFSTAEQDVIQSVWQRVAEDYSMFDVDVTTQDPGAAAIDRTDSTDQVYGTRLLITNANTIYSSCGCGGIAYVGVFDTAGTSHAYYQPAFAFERGLGGGTNAKYLAEAASHEVGHNLGLSHDGQTTSTGTTAYYSGQGSWAPIMGVGYYEPLVQWSKGEYLNANNTEDDFAVMQSNGVALRADDVGDTAATATALGAGPSLAFDGRITTRTDVDVFAFNAAAGPVTLTATPAPTSPDLDIRLQLRDAAGTLLAASDPAVATVSQDVASGLSASISTTLATPGTYYVSVDGVGWGDPLTTGYTDYASVGQYSLRGTVTAGTPNQPPNAVVGATPTSGVAPVTVAFDGSGSSDPDGTVSAYSWSFGDGTTGSGVTTSHTYATAGTYTATLTVTDNGGLTASNSVTISVTNPPAPAAPSNVALTPNGTTTIRTVTIAWTDNASNETGFQVQRETYNAKTKTWGSATIVATVGANVTSTTNTPGFGTFRYSVRAQNGGGTSAWALSGNTVTINKR